MVILIHGVWVRSETPGDSLVRYHPHRPDERGNLVQDIHDCAAGTGDPVNIPAAPVVEVGEDSQFERYGYPVSKVHCYTRPFRSSWGSRDFRAKDYILKPPEDLATIPLGQGLGSETVRPLVHGEAVGCDDVPDDFVTCRDEEHSLAPAGNGLPVKSILRTVVQYSDVRWMNVPNRLFLDRSPHTTQR